MSHSATKEARKKGTLPAFLPLAPAPALVLGLLLMQISHDNPSIWAQNLLAGTAGILLCWGAVFLKGASRLRLDWFAYVVPFLLSATLADVGLGGVHRWVHFGPVRLHAAAILLPAFLVACEYLVTAGKWRHLAVLAGFITLLLILQPDAAQASAFVLAATILLFPGADRSAFRLIFIVALLVLVGFSWARHDPLPSVPYVEGIFWLAVEKGPVWSVWAVISLLLLPLLFLLIWWDSKARSALALFAYTPLLVAASFWGNFPVPVMGYGLSPIAGYFLGLGLLLLPHPFGDSVSTPPNRPRP